MGIPQLRSPELAAQAVARRLNSFARRLNSSAPQAACTTLPFEGQREDRS